MKVESYTDKTGKYHVRVVDAEGAVVMATKKGAPDWESAKAAFQTMREAMRRAVVLPLPEL